MKKLFLIVTAFATSLFSQLSDPRVDGVSVPDMEKQLDSDNGSLVAAAEKQALPSGCCGGTTCGGSTNCSAFAGHLVEAMKNKKA